MKSAILLDEEGDIQVARLVGFPFFGAVAADRAFPLAARPRLRRRPNRRYRKLEGGREIKRYAYAGTMKRFLVEKPQTDGP
jgi:hypothetical protein